MAAEVSRRVGRHCWSKRRSSANSVGHFDGNGKKEDRGAVALVVDLAKAFERVSLQVVWAWATHFSLARKDLAGALRLF